MATGAGPNAQQIEYWNTGAGPTWASLQAPLDRQLGPLGRRAMAVLDPQPGWRILDIGCGTGETTLDLAGAVSPGGEVVGVDVSRPLLDIARRRSMGRSGAVFLEADAQTQRFGDGAFDAVFSRFGVMFFADPAAAFANLRRSLKPGGRLAFVCWRPLADNPLLTLPMEAAAQHVAPPPPSEPGAPGPFAFADPQRPRSLLAAAGFADIKVEPYDLPVGGGSLDDALELALRVGPLGSLLRENPDKREPVISAIRARLAEHDGPDGVKLPSATWIVSARAGA